MSISSSTASGPRSIRCLSVSPAYYAITFREFATIYLRYHAELHKRSVARDREIIRTLNRFFSSVLLHELAAHRLEQFNRDRIRRQRLHLFDGNCGSHTVTETTSLTAGVLCAAHSGGPSVK